MSSHKTATWAFLLGQTFHLVLCNKILIKRSLYYNVLIELERYFNIQEQ